MTLGGIGRRLALVAGGLVAGLALLEVLLRLGSLVAPRLFDRSTAPTAGGDVRILCVGDSHTFGALVRPDQAYPERLERYLRGRGVAAKVFNLGIPGQNSRQVRNHLPHELDRYRPELVLVLVGLNNYWNQTERADGGGGFRPELRVVRFVRLLADALRHQPEVEARRPDMQMIEDVRGKGQRWIRQDGGDPELLAMQKGAVDLDLPAIERVTAEDFTDIARIVREHGATPVFVTYPIELTDNARTVNRATATVAARDGVLRIETRRVLARLYGHGRRGLFFEDLHPKAPLYDEIARDAGKRLVRRGLVRPAPAPG